MDWQGRRQSGNIVDRRGVKTAGTLGGGALIIALIYALLGGDPRVILDRVGGGDEQPGQTGAQTAAGDEQKAFIGVVLADTEDVWRKVFAERGATYAEPKLVLFSGQVDSACGSASSAVGPFYCPADRQVYLDLAFFADLERKLGAGGDFARAYVVAHEVGHHVQNLLGISQAMQAQRGQISESAFNKLSVQVELQADCMAGVWAKQTEEQKQVLDADDISEAIGAAAAVGDDRLQQQSQGRVVPDSFTHGSSAQRVQAFERGLGQGRLDDCEAYNIAH